MAYYQMNENLPLVRKLREGMNKTRQGMLVLQDLRRTLNQMSNAQISAGFGFDEANDHAIAIAAKDELNAGIGNELVANVALEQMLAQFDG